VRSLNVKKVAAIASGMGLLGAAFAGAVSVDSGLSSFPFFTNGEPNVKIAVGTNAAASDGVVAANIAAMIGNLAYKDQAVTVLGIDQLSCNGGAGGSGSCDLSNKKVTLTVTTPGVNPASAFSMQAYVNDNVDFNPDTTRNTTTSFSTTNTSFNSPVGPKVITKDKTPVLSPHGDLASDGKIAYSKGSTNTKEEQRVYALAKVQYDETSKSLQAKEAKTGYEAIFTDPIPLCLDTSKSYANCADNDKVTKNNVRITFLGEKWTIMEVTASGAGASQVILGKEIQHKDIMRVGDSATTPDGFTVTLVDLSGFGYGANALPRVSFTITDSNDNLIKQITVDENATSTTVSEANNLVIKVNSAFPGAFAKEAYADVSLYSNKLDITHNQEVSGGDSHKNWKAMIWGASVGSSEGIARIQIFNDVDQIYKTPIATSLNPGESIDIIKGLAGFKFNYLGLEDVDYDSLTFSIQKSQTLPIATEVATGNMTAVIEDFVLIQSGKSNAFQLQKNVDSVYVKLSEFNTTSGIQGTVYYYDSGTGWYITNTSATGGALNANNATALLYHYSSTESAGIQVTNNTWNGTSFNDSATATHNGTLILIPEITEDANGTTAQVSGTAASSNFHWTLQYDGTLRQFVNTIGTTTIDKIGYDSLNGLGVDALPTTAPAVAAKEPGYTSNRGGIFNAISSTSATFSYPTTVAHAKFTLTQSGISASANEADYTLSEGDSQDIGGGYSILVKEITADAAVDETVADEDEEMENTGTVSGVSNLKPSVSNAAVVTKLSAGSPLVVFDTEAGDTASLVVIGGPVVNSHAQRAGITVAPGSEPIVKVMGSKVYVLGYTAADTQAAGTELVRWLASNRDSVRG